MNLWFQEYHTRDTYFSFRVEHQIYSRQSEFQKVDVYESPDFGKVLVLDQCLMLTEKDEFIYHEMITHVPLAVHPAVRDVLIIGGGDGGALRELAQYQTIESFDLVEIDPLVVEVSRQFFPEVACAFDDPRLNLMFADGLKYVRTTRKKYDLIIVDSTDPFGPGESLFTKEFYGNCFKALREDGLLVNQHESPYYREDAREVRSTRRKTCSIFPINCLYQAHIPTYPSGHWLFGFISKKYDPVRDLRADEWNALGLKTQYYNTNLHRGSFALPNYVLRLIGELE